MSTIRTVNPGDNSTIYNQDRVRLMLDKIRELPQEEQQKRITSYTKTTEQALVTTEATLEVVDRATEVAQDAINVTDNALDIAQKTQKLTERLLDLIEKDSKSNKHIKKTISDVEALGKMQEQQGEQIVQCNKNAEQQTLLIETLEATLSPVSEEPTLDQYEKVLTFVDQLSQLSSEAQLPVDKQRVESLKKILAAHKTQEDLIKDLEEELQALSSDYTKEVDLLEELADQFEQLVLTRENK